MRITHHVIDPKGNTPPTTCTSVIQRHPTGASVKNSTMRTLRLIRPLLASATVDVSNQYRTCPTTGSRHPEDDPRDHKEDGDPWLGNPNERCQRVPCHQHQKTNAYLSPPQSPAPVAQHALHESVLLLAGLYFTRHLLLFLVVV